MRVEFDATLDDLVDVQLRSLKCSRVARGWRWESTISAGLVAGVIMFLLVPEPFEAKIALGVVGLLAGAAVYSLVYRATVQSRTRDYCREFLGKQNSFIVEVELGPEGVQCKQLGVQSTIEWGNIEGVQESHDSVDILLRAGGLIAVRKRAFESREARDEFVQLAEQYTDQSMPPERLSP